MSEQFQLCLRLHMFKLPDWRTLFVFAILLHVGFLNAMASNQPETIQPMLSENIEYDWPVDDVLGTRIKLRIPAHFLDRGADDHSKDVFCPDSPRLRVIWFKALWPSLEPIAAEDQAKLSTSAEHPVSELGETLNLIVLSKAVHDCNGKHFDALQDQLDSDLEVLKEVWVPVKIPVKKGTLYIDEWGTKTIHQKYPDKKSPRFGLRHFGIDFKKYPDVPKDRYSDFHRNDVYYAQNSDGTLENVIWCDAEEVESSHGYFNPICFHEFVLKPLNASVSIQYKRIYLKDWSAIQSRLEMLFQSFVVNP